MDALTKNLEAITKNLTPMLPPYPMYPPGYPGPMPGLGSAVIDVDSLPTQGAVSQSASAAAGWEEDEEGVPAVATPGSAREEPEQVDHAEGGRLFMEHVNQLLEVIEGMKANGQSAGDNILNLVLLRALKLDAERNVPGSAARFKS